MTRQRRRELILGAIESACKQATCPLKANALWPTAVAPRFVDYKISKFVKNLYKGEKRGPRAGEDTRGIERVLAVDSPPRRPKMSIAHFRFSLRPRCKASRALPPSAGSRLYDQ